MTTPIDAISFLPPLQALPLDNTGAAAAGPGFLDWMAREVAATNDRVVEAERGVQRLAAGDTSNLHHVMLDIEKARLQFQLLVQVRNRVLEAYQDVLRMQV